MDKTKINRYPKSVNGHQCVGPCYHHGVRYRHPIYMDKIYNDDGPACPVTLYKNENGKDVNADKCLVPTHKKEDTKEMELIGLTPYIAFNDDYFLNIYYGISTFEEGLSWINNNYELPTLTLSRIFNMSMKVYGNGINIIDNRITQFIERFLKKKIDKISEKNLRYVGSKNSHIMLMKPRDNNDEKARANVKERQEYLSRMFINEDEIYKFMVKYFKGRKDEWSDINDHVNRITNDMAEYIEQKIKKTLKM